MSLGIFQVCAMYAPIGMQLNISTCWNAELPFAIVDGLRDQLEGMLGGCCEGTISVSFVGPAYSHEKSMLDCYDSDP